MGIENEAGSGIACRSHSIFLPCPSSKDSSTADSIKTKRERKREAEKNKGELFSFGMDG